jgi:hypothetical protein
MAKQPKAILQNDRRTPLSETEGRRNRVRGSFLSQSDDDAAPDRRYLEVVEEMLIQRENNGRDRDDPGGAAKDST